MKTPEFLSARTLPLPAKLKGELIYRKMDTHRTFPEGEGTITTFSFYELNGQPLPFTYQFRTGSKREGVNFQGFTLDGWEEHLLSLPELLASWAEYLAERKERA